MYGTARLAQMNLLLHGIGRASGAERGEVRDALADVPKERASLVLANPPFGRKSGFTSLDAGRPRRQRRVPSLPPEVIAQEIVEDLQAALADFTAVAEALQATKAVPGGERTVG